MTKRSDQPSDDPAMGSVDPALHPPRAFPEQDWLWFIQRCAELCIGHAEGRRAALEALYGHLAGVNRWLNLTTIVAPRDYLKLHILDSLALAGDPRLRHLSQGAPCVDLGSGGGYPGLPLAMWHAQVPWVLVDARHKKVEFLAAACTLTGNARARALHLRGAEARTKAVELRRSCQLVTCRAMGRAAVALAESADLLHKGGHLALYKGPAFAGEERDEALAACARLGYRLVNQREVVLEEGDPARVMAIFQRLY
jgi:16S rRNA (guanine527-N7)-methyltransferase